MLVYFLWLVAIVASLYFVFKVSAYRTYDMSDWAGRLWKWADENNISHKKLPRHNKEYLLKIKELDIQNMNIKELPVELFDLTNLKILNISGNNISCIPDEITKLSLDEFCADDNPNIEFSSEQKEWAKKINKFSRKISEESI